MLSLVLVAFFVFVHLKNVHCEPPNLREGILNEWNSEKYIPDDIRRPNDDRTSNSGLSRNGMFFSVLK